MAKNHCYNVQTYVHHLYMRSTTLENSMYLPTIWNMLCCVIKRLIYGRYSVEEPLMDYTRQVAGLPTNCHRIEYTLSFILLAYDFFQWV
jgi:hypothetical protein